MTEHERKALTVIRKGGVGSDLKLETLQGMWRFIQDYQTFFNAYGGSKDEIEAIDEVADIIRDLAVMLRERRERAYGCVGELDLEKAIFIETTEQPNKLKYQFTNDQYVVMYGEEEDDE